MNIHAVLADKQAKVKAKVETLSKMLLDGDLDLADMIEAARALTGSDKGTCIEAIEFATKARPEIASLECLKFVSDSLLDKAPRVKWESAKVIGNIAHVYPDKLDRTIGNLLTNSEFPGTVVRWSAAFALGKIVELNMRRNKGLIPAIEAIVKREEDNAIKKIYQVALKQVADPVSK